jgi:hypothetical protein
MRRHAEDQVGGAIRAIKDTTMPTKEDLERMAMPLLAVLCGRVAEDPKASSVEADQARDMKQEWTLLVASETPPSPSLEKHREYEAKMERLKRKMVSFLAAVLPAH